MVNTEFPDIFDGVDSMPPKMRETYSVGDVIVRPHIVHGTLDTDYKLAVSFYSKTNDWGVSVKEISSLINGKNDFCGDDGFNPDTWYSSWELYPENSPYYVLSIWGTEEVSLSVPILKKSRVEVCLVAAVKKNDGQIIWKRIHSCFMPRKRSYLE